MTKVLGFLVLLCSVAAACGTSDTTTTVLEPAADRLPADPEAPAADWVAGINAAGWDFHRHLKGNAVSSPMSIGVAFSLSRAGASADSGAALDKIFGFPEVGLCRPPTCSDGSARWGSAPAPASTASPVASSSPPRSTAPE